MRDHSVDLMVEIARSCKPGGGGTKGDAVRAIRMCFEIMELMKLVSGLFFFIYFWWDFWCCGDGGCCVSWSITCAVFYFAFFIIFDRHRTDY